MIQPDCCLTMRNPREYHHQRCLTATEDLTVIWRTVLVTRCWRTMLFLARLIPPERLGPQETCTESHREMPQWRNALGGDQILGHRRTGWVTLILGVASVDNHLGEIPAPWNRRVATPWAAGRCLARVWSRRAMETPDPPPCQPEHYSLVRRTKEGEDARMLVLTSVGLATKLVSESAYCPDYPKELQTTWYFKAVIFPDDTN